MIDVIAELGINHDGSVAKAKELIDHLAYVGVRSVKLQYRNQDRLWSIGRAEIGDEILKAELLRTHLAPDELVEIASHGRHRGCRVGISFFLAEDVEDFSDSLASFDFFKVPSAELANIALVERLLDTDKLVLISTGGHSDDDVLTSLSRISHRGNWMALHAVMNYPTAAHNAQLGFISRLREITGRPVGYSSHDEHWAICLLAVQSGASFIERHCTHSTLADGLDHSSSSIPSDFGHLTNLLNNLPNLFSGSERRIVNQGERINLQNLGRSFYARDDYCQGETVGLTEFDLRSPAVGVPRSFVEPRLSEGLVLETPLCKGASLGWQHVAGPQKLKDGAVQFANEKRIGIPVRPLDIQELHYKIPVGHLELHLSYGDVAGRIDDLLLPDIASLSIHLPDYASSTQLLDPFSADMVLRSNSKAIVMRCVELGRRAAESLEFPVQIVGSFSQSCEDRDLFYSRCHELSDELGSDGVDLCFQWLPPYAWYFGGSVALHVFNSSADVDCVKSLSLPICLDLSHFLMGTAGGIVDFDRDFGVLLTHTKHVHLAGAEGVDGEGVELASLEKPYVDVLPILLESPVAKVIEPWQGHLNGGDGFIRELNWLASEFSS